MGWRDDLRPGSFRGVPFYIKESEAKIGRRTADHQYAGRDAPYSEDMGRKQREFTLTVHVIGRDYMAERDALIDALETKGPGKLIHPYLGEMDVTVTATVRESTQNGGMAIFTLNCKEAGHNGTPDVSTDTRQILTDKALAAEAAAITSFEAVYNVDGPAFIADGALEQAQAAIDAIASLTGEASIESSNVAALIRKPADLAQQIMSSLSSLKGTADAPIQALGRYQSLAGFSSQPVSGTTPSRLQEAQNATALQSLVRQGSAIQSANQLASVEFETEAQAEAEARTVSDTLESVAWDADDDAYQALTDVRIAVQKDLTERRLQLPQVQTVELPQSTPALVAAYRHTGSAENEHQIIARNNVEHPGFVSGSIEVINV